MKIAGPGIIRFGRRRPRIHLSTFVTAPA